MRAQLATALHVLVVQQDAVRRFPLRHAIQHPNQSSSVSEPSYARFDAVISVFLRVQGQDLKGFVPCAKKVGWYVVAIDGWSGALAKSPDDVVWCGAALPTFLWHQSLFSTQPLSFLLYTLLRTIILSYTLPRRNL